MPNFVGSPTELAQTCNYIQIFVGDDDALIRMIQVITPSLTSRHVIIPHATVSPDTMREAAALVQRRGARLLEAPFTGSKMAAEKGQLVYYVGGDEQTLREVRPLLETSSKAILHIGDIGHASIVKVATNLVTAAEVQAAAEAMGLVHYSGIPLEKFSEAMKHNGSNSATLEMKIPAIINSDFEPHFSVKHMLKDMQIANRLGRQYELDLGLAPAARDRLLDQVRHGRGDQDYSSVAQKFLPFVESSSLDDLQPDLFSQIEAENTPAEPPDFMQEEEIEPVQSSEFIERQMAQLEPATVAQPHTYGAIELPPVEAVHPRNNLQAHVAEPEPEITLPEAPEPPRETAPPVSAPRANLRVQVNPPEEKRGGFFSRFLGRSSDY